MPDGTATGQTTHPSLDRRGRLELSFAAAPDGRTYIDRQYSSYPFHVCRPFYLDGGTTAGMATVYTQSCSGGLYSLDRLVTEMTVGENAQAHLTSQASTIVHKGAYGGADQACHITAGPGALVEYLPDATILFPGARLKSSVTLQIAETARAVLFDSFLAHDYGGGDGVFDLFENDIRILAPDGAPLAIDRFRITGAEFADAGVGRMGGYRCHGSVIVVAPGVAPEPLIDAAREAVGDLEGAVAGLSLLPLVDGFSARILAKDAVPMTRAMRRLWELSRSAMTGQAPPPRRK